MWLIYSLSYQKSTMVQKAEKKNNNPKRPVVNVEDEDASSILSRDQMKETKNKEG